MRQYLLLLSFGCLRSDAVARLQRSISYEELLNAINIGILKWNYDFII